MVSKKEMHIIWSLIYKMLYNYERYVICFIFISLVYPITLGTKRLTFYITDKSTTVFVAKAFGVNTTFDV